MIIIVRDVYSWLLSPFLFVSEIYHNEGFKKGQMIQYVFVQEYVNMGSVCHSRRNGPNVCIGGDGYTAQLNTGNITLCIYSLFYGSLITEMSQNS